MARYSIDGIQIIIGENAKEPVLCWPIIPANANLLEGFTPEIISEMHGEYAKRSLDPILMVLMGIVPPGPLKKVYFS